jgi:hypothetical protein
MARIIGFAVHQIVYLYLCKPKRPHMCGADLSDLDDIDFKNKKKAMSKEDASKEESVSRRNAE